MTENDSKYDINTDNDQVVLTDEKGRCIGEMGKMEAHQKGLLHRAFSVFIFNDKGEIMLQRRALSKYHSPGLWTNACCSHQRVDESTLEASRRRLLEEMGISCVLSPAFEFIYRVEFDNGLIEHEYDHVLIGNYNDYAIPNSNEVEEWGYYTIDYLKKELIKSPQNYTVWFKIALPRVIDYIKIKNQ